MPDNFQYVKLPDGSYGKFRSDATDDVIRSAISKDFPNAFKSAAAAKEPFGASALGKATGIGPQESHGPVIDTIDKAREWLENKATGGAEPGTSAHNTGEFMGSLPLGALRMARGGAELTSHPWQATKDIVGGASQATTMPGMVIAPEGAGAAAGAASELIPSAARAGRKFEDVMSAARNVPINAEATSQAALRGKELASRGGQLPKILRDFVRRTADTDAPRMTYEEARDFYTNARLAMSEYLQTKPNMWRQVTIFKSALGTALHEAAHEAGKGSEYLSAMKEYRQAKAVQNLIQAAAKIGIPLAIGYKMNKALGVLSKAGE